MLIRRKCVCYRDEVVAAGTDGRKLATLLSYLTSHKGKKKLPDGLSDPQLVDKFKDYFNKKTGSIVTSLHDAGPAGICSYLPDTPCIALPCFTDISFLKFQSIMKNIKMSHCALDGLPMAAAAQEKDLPHLVHIILNIVNLSECIFP